MFHQSHNLLLANKPVVGRPVDHGSVDAKVKKIMNSTKNTLNNLLIININFNIYLHAVL